MMNWDSGMERTPGLVRRPIQGLRHGVHLVIISTVRAQTPPANRGVHSQGIGLGSKTAAEFLNGPGFALARGLP